jgi:hypothetical protein
MPTTPTNTPSVEMMVVVRVDIGDVVLRFRR